MEPPPSAGTPAGCPLAHLTRWQRADPSCPHPVPRDTSCPGRAPVCVMLGERGRASGLGHEPQGSSAPTFRPQLTPPAPARFRLGGWRWPHTGRGQGGGGGQLPLPDQSQLPVPLSHPRLAPRSPARHGDLPQDQGCVVGKRLCHPAPPCPSGQAAKHPPPLREKQHLSAWGREPTPIVSHSPAPSHLPPASACRPPWTLTPAGHSPLPAPYSLHRAARGWAPPGRPRLSVSGRATPAPGTRVQPRGGEGAGPDGGHLLQQ